MNVMLAEYSISTETHDGEISWVNVVTSINHVQLISQLRLGEHGMFCSSVCSFP